MKGEIIAELLTDFPDRFEQVSTIYAVRKDEVEPLKLENYWFQNDRVVLKFAGFDDIDKAKELVGCDFSLPETERVLLSEDEYYDWELEGSTVLITTGRELGKVTSILRTGGVALLVVSDESGREHLVPLAESIVISVDIAARRITIDPPEGLLDL